MIQEETGKLAELLDYLEDPWEGLYGSWSLRGKVMAQEVLPVPRPTSARTGPNPTGSSLQDPEGRDNRPGVMGGGAVEKNIELLIGRKLEKMGMSWGRGR